MAVVGGNDTFFFFFIFGGGVGLVEVTGWIKAGWELATDIPGTHHYLHHSVAVSSRQVSYFTSLNLGFLIWTVGRRRDKKYFVRLSRIRRL